LRAEELASAPRAYETAATCAVPPRRCNMKRVLLAGVAVLALAGPAFAQSGTMTTTARSASATVTIAPEQRTKIKQFVVEKKVQPVTVKEKIVVGATLPADVELQGVPAGLGQGRG